MKPNSISRFLGQFQREQKPYIDVDPKMLFLACVTLLGVYYSSRTLTVASKIDPDIFDGFQAQS